MKNIKQFILSVLVGTLMVSFTNKEIQVEKNEEVVVENDSNFLWKADQFADINVLRYKIDGWDKLTLQQKKLAYYLSQAGYAGRDIIWDQNYRHNLKIRRALENIVQNYAGDKSSENWKNFIIYTKKVWFANGIHHHYSMDKFKPEFSKEYFTTLL